MCECMTVCKQVVVCECMTVCKQVVVHHSRCRLGGGCPGTGCCAARFVARCVTATRPLKQLQTHIHTRTHTYIHTHIDTHIHTHTHMWRYGISVGAWEQKQRASRSKKHLHPHLPTIANHHHPSPPPSPPPFPPPCTRPPPPCHTVRSSMPRWPWPLRSNAVGTCIFNGREILLENRTICGSLKSTHDQNGTERTFSSAILSSVMAP